jgi:hypothetical protein
MEFSPKTFKMKLYIKIMLQVKTWKYLAWSLSLRSQQFPFCYVVIFYPGNAFTAQWTYLLGLLFRLSSIMLHYY